MAAERVDHAHETFAGHVEDEIDGVAREGACQNSTAGSVLHCQSPLDIDTGIVTVRAVTFIAVEW